MWNKFLCKIYAIVYQKWLWDGDTVDKVFSWRRARIKSKGGNVKHMEPVFWWFD